jgi:SAM-dependent methyltransferase
MGHSGHDGQRHTEHAGHKFPVEQMVKLDSPERLSLLPIDAVVTLSGARPGTRILDVGCGPGVFTIPLARAAGSAGHVYAADILPEMVDACRARAAAAGLAHVEVALSTENDVPFPDRCADLVLACHLLHELHDPPLFFAEMRRLLAPDGRLVVVDWEKVETGIGPPVDKRVTAEEAATLLETNGFVVDSRASVTWANYLLRARAAARPGPRTAPAED